MDEAQGEERQGEERHRQTPPIGYIYEFGTWRLVPARAARQTTSQGRPPKKKGG